VKIDPVPKCLNGRDDSGRKLAPGYNLEVTGQGPEGQTAEPPEEPAVIFEEDAEHLNYGPGPAISSFRDGKTQFRALWLADARGAKKEVPMPIIYREIYIFNDIF